jgi:hypothetical protein
VGFDCDEIVVALPGQSEVVPFPIDDLSQGLLPRLQYGDWEHDRSRTFENQGVHVHIPGMAIKGYASSVSEDLISADFSGARAANFKVHHVQWPTSSGIRNIFGFKSYIITDTSATDPTPKVPSTADNVTDNIMAMWLGDVSGTLALFIGTDGQTDDVKYTTDPTADTISWTSAVTFPHTDDVVYAGCYLPQFRKHVIWGVINQVAGVYAWKNTDSLPMTSSTLEPVVFTQDRNVEGSIPTVTTSAINPTNASARSRSGDTGEPQRTSPTSSESGDAASWWSSWSGFSNITSSNDSRVTASTNFYAAKGSGGDISAPVDILSDVLEIFGFDLTSVPKAAIITGLQGDPEVSEADAGDNIYWSLFQWALNGNAVGVNLADGTELPTSEAAKTFGGATNRAGTSLRGADIQRGLSQLLQFISDEGNTDTSAGGGTTVSGSARVDTSTTTITYRMPGTQVPIMEGMHGKGSALLSFPNIVPIIEPVSDDATGIMVQRRLAYYTFSVDEEFDRLLCDVSYPYTGLPYVGVMSDHLGGLAIGGGADSDTWDQVVLVGPDSSQRDVENLELPSTYGDLDTVRLYGMFERQASAALFAGIYHGDEADAQLWLSSGNGRWNAYGVLQGLSGTSIASAPIPFAMFNPITHAYRFFPHSTTGLHVQYEFVDNDPHADPLLTSPSENRHTGALRVQLPHLNMGKGDARKTVTAIEVDSFEVDDGTNYGSVAVEFDAGQDLTMATPDVDETFNDAAEVFVRRNIDASGVAFDTGIVALELGQTTGAKTPQALPVTLYLVVSQNNDRIIDARGVKPDMTGWDTLAKLEALQGTKSVQPLMGMGLMDESGGKGGIPTTLESLSVQNKTLTLRFREVPGKSGS